MKIFTKERVEEILRRRKEQRERDKTPPKPMLESPGWIKAVKRL